MKMDASIDACINFSVTIPTMTCSCRPLSQKWPNWNKICACAETYEITILRILQKIIWLIHKEGHADPLSEMTPSKSDCIWCAMF